MNRPRHHRPVHHDYTTARSILLMLLTVILAGLITPVMASPALSQTLNQPISQAEQAFIKQHWTQPLAPQGTPPDSYSALESSLYPQDCGTCHPDQYRDWQQSLHSKAMGPGVWGQVIEMQDKDPAMATLCWQCHTPLAEQKSRLPVIKGRQRSWPNNPDYDPKLHQAGLVCAVCHVRQHQRFGPTRQAGKGNQESGQQNVDGPHQGFIAQTAFSRAAFCSGCHQFVKGDFALNGKYIENTYQEWLDSPYPAKGVQCQTCHMPDRRHLWKGIHDPAMVKSGVDIKVDVPQTSFTQNDAIKATITVTNTGVGHLFPTYLTPKVFIRAHLERSDGSMIENTAQEAVIGREVPLDLSHEISDTRIPPGEDFSVDYLQTIAEISDVIGITGINNEPARLKVSIVVEPDHYYAMFYRDTLKGLSPEQAKTEANQLIKQALANTQDAIYTLFEKTVELTVKAAITPLTLSTPSTPPQSIKADNPNQPDWNEAAIPWVDYETGLRLASTQNKPIMMILYADWCPTCHAYKKVFHDLDVVTASADFIMVRVNIDEQPKIDQRYNVDGGYVPRTFIMDTDATLMDTPYPQRSYAQYFLAADPETFIDLMAQVSADGEH